MRDFEVADVFKIKRRVCVVVKMNLYGFGEYHNGYVSVSKKHQEAGYDDFISKIETDELTFGGDLNHLEDERIPKDISFFGFDSAHAWNQENPESATFQSVRERTIKLAQEMMAKRI